MKIQELTGFDGEGRRPPEPRRRAPRDQRADAPLQTQEIRAEGVVND
jgi:hypothetical protein